MEDRMACDLLKLAGSAALFASPWAFAFTPSPAWNLWVCGYVMLTVSLAALVAEADWEAQTNLCLGVWMVAAPWIFGFVEESTATFLHLVGGGVVSLLSVVELLNGERNPPWRFGPSAASRGHLASTMADQLETSTRPAIVTEPLSSELPRPVPQPDRPSRTGNPDDQCRGHVIFIYHNRRDGSRMRHLPRAA